MLTRGGEMLFGRAHGPLDFRLIFQPTMAALLAIARSRRTPVWDALPMAGPFSPSPVTGWNCFGQAARTWAGSSSPPSLSTSSKNSLSLDGSIRVSPSSRDNSGRTALSADPRSDKSDRTAFRSTAPWFATGGPERKHDHQRSNEKGSLKCTTTLKKCDQARCRLICFLIAPTSLMNTP
jgi:hypothetical protein